MSITTFIFTEADETWSGAGYHSHYYNYYGDEPFSPSDNVRTRIVEDRNSSTRTSTFTFYPDMGYPPRYQFAYPTYVTNQSYTLTIGNVTRQGSLPDQTVDYWLVPIPRVPFPNSLTYTLSHSQEVYVPYSIQYSATLRIDQNDSTILSPPPNYATFNVVISRSGTVYSGPFYGPLYGSVNNRARKITKLYGSVNGAAREITKLYASVNGVAKRIF